jgi:predicted phage tail component-like protein
MGNDYFVFDDITSTNKYIYLINYTPIFIPESKKSYKELNSSNDTIISKNDSYKDVNINCEVAILGNDEIDIANKVSEATIWLSKRSKLRFWDSLDKYYIGEVYGLIEMSRKRRWNDFTINFRCNPIKYGLEVITNYSVQEKNNLGTYKTKGKINATIKQNTSFVTFTLLSTGEKVHIIDSFLVDDVVEVDLLLGKVFKNGVLINKKVSLESDFFFIPSGEYSIIANPSSTIFDISYIERWL